MIDSIKAKLDHPFVSRHLVPWIVPVLFLIVVMFFYPQRAEFLIDFDEGVDLMKTMLMDQGYTPHEDIWSEHPPMFNYLLLAGFRLVGYKVGFSRYIVLGMSILLIWAAGQILRIIWGTKVSLVGQALLFFLPQYLKLSVAVMNGIPSITFAMLSLWALLEWDQKRKYPWLVVSALLLALSVLTKISLGILGPIFCLGLLLGEWVHYQRKIRFSELLPPLVFGLAFSLVLIGGAVFLIGLDNLDQIFSMLDPSIDLGDLVYKDIHYYLYRAWPWILLGGIGAFEAVRAKKWLAAYLVTWAVSIYLLLLNHAPVWGHHQLYITVPLALLGAQPASRALERFRKMLSENFSPSFSYAFQIIALFALMAILLPFQLPESIGQLSPLPAINPVVEMGPKDEMVMAHMALYKDQTEWVVTDNPIYAFRSRLLVPPEITVFSRKRLATGEVAELDMIQAIEKYQPEQVLLWRIFLPEVNTYLEENYYRVYENGDKNLWLRNDIEPIPLN